MNEIIASKINHLFRNEYTKLISYLTSKFGVSKIDIIENAVQDALLKAMQLWSFNEIPPNPSKWLYRVSYNTVIDTLRRQSKTLMFNPEIMNDYLEENYDFDKGIEDNQLQMIFACCHPLINENDKIILSLKLLCGFSNDEIARVLFKNTEAIKKGLSRAKKTFKAKVEKLSFPPESELSSRLDTILKIIYLLFTNGYTAYNGNDLLKRDVCEDAIRLAGLLYVNKHCNTPNLQALIALMSYNLSRFEARTSNDGYLVTMKDQDRKLWDKDLIQLGNNFILLSNKEPSYSTYHLEAAIAREYAISTSYDTINWKSILAIYDVLVSRTKSSTMSLNRLVVLSKVKGSEIALKELNLLNDKTLLNNHHYYSVKGEFEKELKLDSYKNSLQKAISLTNNEKEKHFLKDRLE
jgi:RNA polymerase sigma factor (sigma-70 family)